MPHAPKRLEDDDFSPRLRMMVGAASPDELLIQAQIALSSAQTYWSAVQQGVAASQAPGGTGWVDQSYAVILKAASSFACESASVAVRAAAGYAPRCAAAASAAAGARPCPGLDLSGEPAGQPWGTVWNGQASVLDRNLVPQVGAQVSQAQASVAAATAAKNASCPVARISEIRPLRMMGAGTDYISQAASLPGAGQAWAQVQTTLQGEGLGTDDIGYAALSFVSAYQQFPLINPSGQVQDAVSAASQFTLNNHSIGAAVGQVEDLVATIASGANPQQVFQAFGGTLMATASLAVGAGAVSFGVGAAIVAGIGILESVIGFNQPPPPVAVVGSCQVYASQPPTIVDGYTWSWGQATTSGPGLKGSAAPYWRRFPDPANPSDAGWFVPYAPTSLSNGQVQWQWMFGGAHHVDKLYTCFAFTEAGKRPVDQISSEPQGPPNGVGGPDVYHQLEAETTWAKLALAANPNDTLSRFQIGFFAAWKANREYGLNGLQQRSDAEVLAQYVRVWNRANTGSTMTIAPASAAPLAWNAGSGVPGMTPYAAIILGSAQGSMPNDVLDSSGNLKINGYSPKLAPIRVGGGIRLGNIGGTASAGSNTAHNVAIGTAAVAVAGLGTAAFVAYRRKTSVQNVLKGVWSSTKSGTRRAYRKVRRLV